MLAKFGASIPACDAMLINLSVPKIQSRRRGTQKAAAGASMSLALDGPPHLQFITTFLFLSRQLGYSCLVCPLWWQGRSCQSSPSVKQVIYSYNYTYIQESSPLWKVTYNFTVMYNTWQHFSYIYIEYSEGHCQSRLHASDCLVLHRWRQWQLSHLEGRKLDRCRV